MVSKQKTYKEEIKAAMDSLARDPKRRFLGYNVKFGSRMYGTLVDVPQDRLFETPLAENLMVGVATGMALEGFKPVAVFERHDFLLNAADQIINHLDKLEQLSRGEFKAKVIIRAVVGAKKPLYPGLQHVQDYTKMFQGVLSFPVLALSRVGEIKEAYDEAERCESPIMLVEWRDLYDETD